MSKKVEIINAIMESKLTEDQKFEHLQFIDEATNYELSSYFADNLEPVKEGVAKSVAGIVLFGGYWVLWRGIAAAASKAHRKCGILRATNQRDVCLAQVRIDQLTKQIQVLEKLKNDCKTRPDPKECVTRTNATISQLKTKLQKQEAKFKQAKAKMQLKGKTEEGGVAQARDNVSVRI